MRRNLERSARAKIAAILVGGAVMVAASGGFAQVGELVDPNRLRVCADPGNLPFSNQAGEGFENEIAELLAQKLGREVAYTWFPQSVGFVRSTLGAGRCDLVIGVATTNELMQNSNPYYRSGYVLVQRAAAERKATSLHDPALEDLRLGAVARTPPVTLLAQRGLLDQLKPYQLVVDTRYQSPGRQMVEDVASGAIDVGVLWGPIAGYWAKQQTVSLEVTPLVGEDKGVRLDFRISMGMRHNEPNWKRQINELLAANADEIQAILMDYGVPLLDEQGQPIPGARAKTKDHGALAPVAEPDGYRMADYRAPVPASLAGATVVSTADLQALLETTRPILLDVLPLPREPANRPAGSLWRPPSREHLPGSALAAQRRLRRAVGRVRALLPRQSGPAHRERPVAPAGVLLRG
jgi:quinoprotein dehydrogenase-associated probable ABC transporter substrate-binding protein